MLSTEPRGEAPFVAHNERMKYGALVGWGIVIYSVMFLAWSGLMMYGYVDGILPRLAGLIVLIVTSSVAGRSLHLRSWKDILPYTLAWAIIVALFDAAFSVPFSGWTLYYDWNVWVGYALVALVPLVTSSITSRNDHARE